MNADLFASVSALTLFFFLFYWILGGAAFSVAALLRIGRIRKGRFSCLFTLICAGTAFGAAKTGLLWAEERSSICVYTKIASESGFAFSCGTGALLMAFVTWAAVTVLLGSLLLRFSRSKERSWLDQWAEKLDTHEPAAGPPPETQQAETNQEPHEAP